MELKEAIGRAIKKARKKAKITQFELGYRCRIDPTTISKLENGKREPAISSFYLIAKALKMTPNELMKMVEEEKPDVPLYEE